MTEENNARNYRILYSARKQLCNLFGMSTEQCDKTDIILELLEELLDEHSVSIDNSSFIT